MLKLALQDVVVLIEAIKWYIFSWSIFHIEGAMHMAQKYKFYLIPRKISKKNMIIYKMRKV